MRRLAPWFGVSTLALIVGLVGVGGGLDLVRTFGARAAAEPQSRLDTVVATAAPATPVGAASGGGPVQPPAGGFVPTSIRPPMGAAAELPPIARLSVPSAAGAVRRWAGGARADVPRGTLVVIGRAAAGMRPTPVGDVALARLGDTLRLADGRAGLTYRVTGRYQVAEVDLSPGADLYSRRVPHRLVAVLCGVASSTDRCLDAVVVLGTPQR